jgi:hypothetical protein
MPSFTTRSDGTKILLYPAISSVQSDYAIGLESGYMWQSVPTTATDMGFVWYGGISQILKLTSVLLTCPAALSVGTTSTFNGTMTTAAISATNITTSGTIVSTGDITAPNLYTKANTNTLLNGKLNNVISGSSLSVKNSSAVDVLVLWNNASKDIEARGTFYVSNDLSVLKFSTLTNTMTVNALNGQGGTIRVIANNNGNESSVACYNYIDLRIASAGDAWVFGYNCWNAPTNALSIGTPGKKSCLSIGVDGVVTLGYKLRTPELLVHTLRGNGETRITIDDNVTITENLIVNGTITDNTRSLNPFWICGTVAANGTVVSSNRGKYGFTCHKTGNGYYIISPTNANCSDTNYIINITCQVDSTYASARINTGVMSVSSFAILTYVGNTAADCIFHFSVIY